MTSFNRMSKLPPVKEPGKEGTKEQEHNEPENRYN
jgi:hypothetical protein